MVLITQARKKEFIWFFMEHRKQVSNLYYYNTFINELLGSKKQVSTMQFLLKFTAHKNTPISSISFLKFHEGNNFISDQYRAAIKTEILLKLPIYSIDRLIYEELLATDNEYSRVITTIIESDVPTNKNSLTELHVEGKSIC